MRYAPFILALVCGAVISAWAGAQDQPEQPLAPTTAVAQDQPELRPKPTVATPLQDCTTAGCHAPIQEFRSLHGPVNVNACDACHQVVDPAQHTFALARQGADLCTFCHQLELPDDAVIHKPVLEGQCLSCHNPHGGSGPSLMRRGSMRALCSQCHEDKITGKKAMHGPVAADSCGACHKSHSAPFANLLSVQGNDLCFTCHAEMKTAMAQAAFVHEAVKQDCNQCHDPHASDFPMQIRQAPLELCASCHEDQRQAALNAPVPHAAVTEGDACLNCHTAHGSSLAKLMKTQPIKMCMSCHSEPIERESMRTVASVAEVLDPNLVKHGPINEGDCTGCHAVHGSQVARLLDKEYPEKFYQNFDPVKYELCFSCHDKQLVELPKTEGLTGFRNGQTNLHYLHVNKEKGRNCRACHSTHASVNPVHVRQSVPFGKWEMPINFTKTQAGGSCSPGCHKPLQYNRDEPVLLPDPLPGADAQP
jgi:predicted CXXCH cytochrome family protein